MIIKNIVEKDPQILVLKIGDKILETLIRHCQNNSIKSAWISAIGAVSSAELAFYDLPNKKYHNQTLSMPMEIASLSGNISRKDNDAIAHVHAVFSDQHMNCFGGHLIEAVVAATCEVKIEIYNTKIIRKLNNDIGLNLIVE